jgi:hypothetical protein
MSIAEGIRKIKMRKSAELRAREARAAKRAAEQFGKKLKNNREPGSMYDPGFVALLDKRAREARERMGNPRPDLDRAIATAREKGHLPPAHDAGTGYVPTAEEILGDEALPKPPAPPGDDTEELPSADEVLNGTPVEGSAFTAEEIAEIDRMNKPRAQSSAQRHHHRGRHRR